MEYCNQCKSHHGFHMEDNGEGYEDEVCDECGAVESRASVDEDSLKEDR